MWCFHDDKMCIEKYVTKKHKHTKNWSLERWGVWGEIKDKEKQRTSMNYDIRVYRLGLLVVKTAK